MKKAITVLVILLVSALITFVFFEAMSWYHFGDIPTKTVLIRLIAFFCVIAGLLIGITALVIRKKK